ncbi:hypothetical protein PIB30_008983 [Stylosanthes scabra]|uniref:Moybdenum cofactor oxidoreductase dimerisation domain-containing protein n=1 Tax=Stylosanthes scabra TaxID=79078 RepID=A0ABU6S4W2_9FABA|nr:hypothetical protein [Stylosanthes scabra]
MSESGVQYIGDGSDSDKWAWVLFEITTDIHQSTEIIAKAIDSGANVQPKKVEDIWNLRGILNTSWHRVKVQAGHSNLQEQKRKNLITMQPCFFACLLLSELQ